MHEDEWELEHLPYEDRLSELGFSVREVPFP